MESVINLLINLNISTTPYSLGYIVDYSSDELEELIDDSGKDVSLDEEINLPDEAALLRLLVGFHTPRPHKPFPLPSSFSHADKNTAKLLSQPFIAIDDYIKPMQKNSRWILESTYRIYSKSFLDN